MPLAKQTNRRLRVGTHLGKYRLRRRLGSGGACEVWEAADRVEGIQVALKIPLAGLNGERDNNSLLREVKAVAKLRHPNILSVKNADIIEGYAVLATEMCTKTLDDCSRPMSVRRLLSIMRQILEALAYAHRNRIIHCDVTPGNIFLFPDQRVTLGDFGIAVPVKGRSKTIEDFGTPGYVAPEQAYGHPTYRSDCFSVGLILYEYITGFLPQWPYEWPPRGCDRLRTRTSTAFAQFVQSSLSIDPNRRFADGGRMLETLLETLPQRYRTVSKPQAKVASRHWRGVRRAAFIKRYQRVFPHLSDCPACGEAVSDEMNVCPWCGSAKTPGQQATPLPVVCRRCHRGLSPRWPYCPWCYGPGFAVDEETPVPPIRYHAKCHHCSGKLARFMRYCPWCHHKTKQNWYARPFPETCNRCRWPVDTEFWCVCPWCRQGLSPG